MSETTTIPTKTVRMRLGDLKLLEVNARFMRHETFNRLQENLIRDGALTSVPFAALTEDGEYEVLSGNHRVKAALAVWGPDREVDVLVTDEVMPRARRVALQLAHNSIVGEDDPATLAWLYQSIEDLDWQTYSGLDDETLALLDGANVTGLAEANLSYQTITMAFLPEEVEGIEAALNELRGNAAAKWWAASMAQLDPFLDALSAVSASYGIENQATAMQILLALYEKHQTELADGYDDDGKPKHAGWVPMSTLFNTDSLPPATAIRVRQALKTLQDRGDITKDNLTEAFLVWVDGHAPKKKP